MKKLIAGSAATAMLFLNSVLPTFAANGPMPKATGGIWMSGPSQQMIFNAHDYGDPVDDKGEVEYWNYDYGGDGLHYIAPVLSAKVYGDESRFMFQIPEGWPGLSGLYVVSWVKDGGTPGTEGDMYGHAATWDSTTAYNWVESGVGVATYPITGGNLQVHAY